MLLHYLKIAWRNIWNDKFYSLINLIGLTIAFTVVFLFVQWMRFELSFEKDNPKACRIYQVQETVKRADGIYKTPYIRPGMHKELKERFPVIEEVVLFERGKTSDLDPDIPITLESIYATMNFLDVFPMQCTAGTTTTKTDETIAFLSEETAIKMYGNANDALGKTISWYGKTIPVIGILRVPKNTMVQFEFLLLLNDDGMFNYSGGTHYVLLKENVILTPEIKKSIGNYLTEKWDSENKLVLQPLKDIHLKTDDKTDKTIRGKIYYGSIKEIRAFVLVVLLVFLLAVINYVNTSTARAMSRAREAGVRKIVGSSRGQLAVRFLTEAFIISLVAVFLAFDIAKVLHRPFENVMGNPFPFHINIFTLSLAAMMVLFTSVMASGYAAFYLSSLNPVSIVLGNTGKPGSKNTLRKILLGVQFAIAIGVLICTWTVYRQLDYMLNKDLGFNKENIYIQEVGYLPEFEDYIERLKRSPFIVNASIASDAPYNVKLQYSEVSWEGAPQGTEAFNFIELSCDDRYAETFGLKLVQGVFIQPKLGWRIGITPETYNIVVNEAFVKLMGVENPLGITVNYGLPGYNKASGEITGVVKDFYFRPMNNRISPLIIRFSPGISFQIFIKINPAHEKEALEYIDKTWNDFTATARFMIGRPPLSLKSMDVDYKELYKTDARMQKILLIFSLASIVLSFMGVMSMVAFIIEKRTKEIGIRKINGARWLDIIREFWHEFLLLAGIATVPAVLISHWFMHNWLQQYVYRPAFGWWVFILVPLFIVALTALILYWQVQSIAKRNPAECLKSE